MRYAAFWVRLWYDLRYLSEWLAAPLPEASVSEFGVDLIVADEIELNVVPDEIDSAYFAGCGEAA
jgi:hypothetical protein